MTHGRGCLPGQVEALAVTGPGACQQFERPGQVCAGLRIRMAAQGFLSRQQEIPGRFVIQLRLGEVAGELHRHRRRVSAEQPLERLAGGFVQKTALHRIHRFVEIPVDQVVPEFVVGLTNAADAFDAEGPHQPVRFGQ